MNTRIEQIAKRSGILGRKFMFGQYYDDQLTDEQKNFAKLLIESVLDEVEQRAYYTGDRDWSDEVDRPWIQLEFGYGKLHDSK